MDFDDTAFGDELRRLVRDWPGDTVVSRRDEPTGTWIFVAIHSSALGRPVGGTRLRAYPHPLDGLRDAMRLAEGMSYKWATIGLDKGGGKAVLAIDRPMLGDERRGLLERYGDLIESMAGAFGTGEDLGTTPEDMAVIGSRTRWVHGVEDDGSVTDPGPFTARGVYHGLKAAALSALSREELSGVRVLIQGVGDVGGPLARELAAEGAVLLLSDLDQERVAALARELDAAVIPPDQVYATACDVFAPCAIGGILNAETIPRLAARVVAGSANNQLEVPGDADRLQARAIVYAPDYVINAGGALAFGLHDEGEKDHQVLMARMAEIGGLVSSVLDEAREQGITPWLAAQRRAERRIAAAREAKD